MQRGSVQLMISEGFIDSLMEHVVGPFCIEHPRINISVNVGSVNEVVEAVARTPPISAWPTTRRWIRACAAAPAASTRSAC